MEKNASLWLKGCVLTRPPCQQISFGRTWLWLPHSGEHSHQELGSSQSHPHPKGSCSSKPEIKADHAVYQLTAFRRQNGKSHCCCSCSGDPSFKHTTFQVSPSISHWLQLSPATCVLDQWLQLWLVTWSSLSLPPCKVWALLFFWKS